jgi:hypothetical protein
MQQLLIHMKYALIITFLLLSGTLSAQSRLSSIASLDAGWKLIATAGLCSAGAPYQFYAKPVPASDNLRIFFNSGGARWFGEACDLLSQPKIYTPCADMHVNNSALLERIFNFEESANPFVDYSMVVIPYGTGDVHIGTGPQPTSTKMQTVRMSVGQEQLLHPSIPALLQSTPQRCDLAPGTDSA